MVEFFHSTIEILVTIVVKLGYFGIFLGMLLESTPIPIPSELIMIPAGIAASKGEINIYLATFLGIFGNLVGAALCYLLSLHFGRKFIMKFGKYLFLKTEIVYKMEGFFKKHGPISVFFGRLIIGFRHFISIPAGLAKMNIKFFYLYTVLGSSIWTSILSAAGYFIGDNQDLIEKYLSQILLLILTLTAAAIIIKIFLVKYKKNHDLP